MNNSFKTAFTLVELLVVITIVGILSGLIIVGMSSSVNSARIAKAQIFSASLRDSLLMDLVAEWKFDGDTNNSWSTSYNGTWHGSGGGANTVANYRPESECVFGQCLNLDGTDDYVTVSSLPYQTVHGPSTIEVWFKLISTVNVEPIFTDSCTEWGIYIEAGNVYGRAYSTLTGGAVSLNAWHHAALVHDHPTGLTSTKIYFYFDGVKKGEATRTITTENGYYDAPYGLGYDTSACGGGGYFNGNIDNLRYYKSAIAASLIEDQYYAGLNKLLAKGELTKKDYQDKLIAFNSYL